MHGSGVCENFDTSSVRVADFVTQIVNKASAVADYTKDGGNQFGLTLPADANNHSGNGVFNLSSQRLFAIGGAGVQHYSLNIKVIRMDANVPCEMDSVALTVLFLP